MLVVSVGFCEVLMVFVAVGCCCWLLMLVIDIGC